ncbi:MAG: Rho termination factor N-terminal domain-containing protein, partial [Candidatus Nanopelagicales bacterium]
MTNTADVSSLLLPELRTFAQDLGVAGAATMRKSELIAAIEAKQNSVDVGIEEVSEIQETDNDQDSAPANQNEDRQDDRGYRRNNNRYNNR